LPNWIRYYDTIDEESSEESRGAKDIFDDMEVMNYLNHGIVTMRD